MTPEAGVSLGDNRTAVASGRPVLGRHAVLVSSRDPRSRVDHGRMTVVRTAVAALAESFGQVTIFHLRPEDGARGEGPANASYRHLSTSRRRRLAHAARVGVRGHRSLNEVAGLDGHQSDQLRRRLGAGARPDLVVLDGTRAAAVLDHLGDVPTLVDLDDLLSDRYRAWADLPFERMPFDMVGTNPASPLNRVARTFRRMLPTVLRAEARSVARIEQLIADRADRVSLVSPREAARFAQRTHRSVDVLPMAAPPAPHRLWEPPVDPAFDAVFLGRTTHLTNLAALDWLGREVVPRLGERLGRPPRIGVAGASSAAVDAWLTDLALEPLGFVADLQELFASAAVAVAPQVVAGGMNTKVLDYAVHGIPVVGTTQAFAGLLGADEVDWQGVDRPDAFAERIVTLRGDHAAAHALSGAARAHVDAYYQPAAVRARWQGAFAAAVDFPEAGHG